jgi:hypothetical protein
MLAKTMYRLTQANASGAMKRATAISTAKVMPLEAASPTRYPRPPLNRSR